ncbi:MAG: hypothetical protein AVDCRST_MAG89-4553, partial [uncultured Gemmatimonadetes bacterium]
ERTARGGAGAFPGGRVRRRGRAEGSRFAGDDDGREHHRSRRGTGAQRQPRRPAGADDGRRTPVGGQQLRGHRVGELPRHRPADGDLDSGDYRPRGNAAAERGRGAGHLPAARHRGGAHRAADRGGRQRGRPHRHAEPAPGHGAERAARAGGQGPELRPRHPAHGLLAPVQVGAPAPHGL